MVAKARAHTTRVSLAMPEIVTQLCRQDFVECDELIAFGVSSWEDGIKKVLESWQADDAVTLLRNPFTY